MSSWSEAGAKLERAIAISYRLLTRRASKRILFMTGREKDLAQGFFLHVGVATRSGATGKDGGRSRRRPSRDVLCVSADRRTALQRAFNLWSYAHAICVPHIE